MRVRVDTQTCRVVSLHGCASFTHFFSILLFFKILFMTIFCLYLEERTASTMGESEGMGPGKAPSRNRTWFATASCLCQHATLYTTAPTLSLFFFYYSNTIVCFFQQRWRVLSYWYKYQEIKRIISYSSDMKLKCLQKKPVLIFMKGAVYRHLVNKPLYTHLSRMSLNAVWLGLVPSLEVKSSNIPLCTMLGSYIHGLPRLVWKKASGLSTDPNPSLHLWDELECWLCTRLIYLTSSLMLLWLNGQIHTFMLQNLAESLPRCGCYNSKREINSGLMEWCFWTGHIWVQ